jgi:xanthine dehydrogenase accessory factor
VGRRPHRHHRRRPARIPGHEGSAPLALFGGGHVGKALVQVLAPLPFAVTWIDSRDEIFPDDVPATWPASTPIRCRRPWPDLAPQSRVLVMSFSHAEDLDVVAACLKRLRERGDLPYVGLIGSKTKWATFRHRLEERGFHAQDWRRSPARSACPASRARSPK